MENKEQDQQDQSDEVIKLDVEKIKNTISAYSSEKLCEMIVADRYFGINQEVAVACMEELSARRVSGDDFAFEQFIDDTYSKLPPLNFTIPDLRTTLQQALKVKK